MAETCFILNPRAGSSAKLDELLAAIRSRVNTDVFETAEAGEATKLADQAARDGATTVIAAGGDGTVHEVVNGLMRHKHRPVLGILPLGTGNDLPRTLGIPLDPVEALKTIDLRRVLTIDLIKVKYIDGELYCCNVAAGGFTGQVDEVMTDEIKSRWGPLAYLRGALGVLPDLTDYKTRVRYDGKAKHSVSAMNVIVANGRTAGGGMVVAPQARIDDGLLDVVVVRSGTTLALAGVATRLLAGDYTDSDAVTHRRAKRVSVESKPGMWFNVDGELITNQKVTFSIVPGALNVIVGDDYVIT